MGGVVLGHHHQPAGVLVQPVHDSRAAHAADARQRFAAMGDQGIDQGPVRVARRRMHDQAGGFVDDQHVVVLKNDIEIDSLRLGRRGTTLGHNDGESLAGFDPIGRVDYRLAIGADAAFPDERLDPGARKVRDPARQHPVEPAARFRFAGGDGMCDLALRCRHDSSSGP